MTMQELYANETPRHAARLAQLKEQFTQLFGESRAIRVFSAPGRSEIGGNHTDHNHGKVLAAAVNLDILGVAAARDDMRICAHSVGHKSNDLDISNLEIHEAEIGKSAAMIRGICAAFVQRTHFISRWCFMRSSCGVLSLKIDSNN